MVVPFGFSAGDFASAIGTLYLSCHDFKLVERVRISVLLAMLAD
jgi:hypothetical protein